MPGKRNISSLHQHTGGTSSIHSKDHPRTDNYENACLKVNTYIDAPFVSYDRTDAAKKNQLSSFIFGQDAS